MSAAAALDLTVPEGWEVTSVGLSFLGDHALDAWAGLDPEGRIVIGLLDGRGFSVRPEPPEWVGSFADWVCADGHSSGIDLEAVVGAEQVRCFRGLLRELHELREERYAPPAEAGVNLAELYDAWQEREAARRPPRRGAVSGRAFILEIPPEPPAIWGEGDRVAWSRGEGAMLYAPQGTGKTSLAQQLLLRRIGLREPEFLGLPVEVTEKKYLYLALDRPPQIARSWRRMVTEEDGELLAERVVVWQGPLPFKLTADDVGQLTRWAQDEHGIDGGIVVDSYKNLVSNLSSEESGALIDSVMQEALAEGLDWLGLHHPRKANGDNKRPNTLDDVYGSTWLTAGIGSVLGLWGKAGDEIVQLAHLKQPAEPVGPFSVWHDHAMGESTRLWLPGGGGKNERQNGVLRLFFQAGAARAALKLADFDSLGAERQTREALKALVDRGVLEVSGSTSDRRWTLVPLSHEGPVREDPLASD